MCVVVVVIIIIITNVERKRAEIFFCMERNMSNVVVEDGRRIEKTLSLDNKAIVMRNSFILDLDWQQKYVQVRGGKLEFFFWF